MRVLWISERQPLPAQLEVFERIGKPVEIYQVKRMGSIDEVVRLAEAADYIVAELPPQALIQLVALLPNKVLVPKIKALCTCDRKKAERMAALAPDKRYMACGIESCRVYEFRGFKMIPYVKPVVVSFP